MQPFTTATIALHPLYAWLGNPGAIALTSPRDACRRVPGLPRRRRLRPRLARLPPAAARPRQAGAGAGAPAGAREQEQEGGLPRPLRRRRRGGRRRGRRVPGLAGARHRRQVLRAVRAEAQPALGRRRVLLEVRAAPALQVHIVLLLC